MVANGKKTTRTAFHATVRPRARVDGTVAHDVRFRIEGRSRSISFETDAAAQKWARILRAIGPAEALKLLKRDLTEGTPTVYEYAERYISAKSGIEGKTTDHYRMFMRLHIGPVMGDLPLDAVTKEMVAGWINAQAEDEVAPKTIKNRHGFLSAMFLSAVEDELLNRNPCAKSKLPDSTMAEMVFLSADEFTTLLAYIPQRYQAIVLLLAGTGLRWGEATALTPADIDLERLTVRVAKAWKSSIAKGWYLGPPKTPRSRRTVPIPEDLADVLRPLVEAGGPFIFTNPRGGPIRQQNFWSGVWNPARRLANGMEPFDGTKADKDAPWAARTAGVWDRKPATVPLGKVPRIHDLRHSHASWLLEGGIGIDVVQRRLGHEKITTTVDTYGHISEARAAAAALSIGRTLAGAMPQLLP